MSLKQINAAEQMMGIALNRQNNIDGLIGYYRDQIDKFNNERALWILNYEKCKRNATDKHLVTKQINDSKARVQKLQAILGVLKGKLNQIRQKYFHQLEEGSRLQLKYQQNQNKLRQTMNMCKPIDSINRSQYSLSINRSKQCGDQKPNNNDTQLQLMLINLTKQHQKKKNYLQNNIDVLKQSLEQIIQENNVRGERSKQDYQNAFRNISQLQDKNMNLTYQLMKQKMSNSQQQTKLQQKSEILRLKNVAMMQKLKKLQKKHTNQLQTIQIEVKKKNRLFKQKYDGELKKKQEHLSIVKEQHQRISQIYLLKIKKLQNQLTNIKEKYKVVDINSKTQLGSLRGQIKVLNGRLEKESIRRMREELADQNQSEQEEDSSVPLQPDELDVINKQVRDLERKIGNNN